MKTNKLVVILFFAVLILSTFACGGGEEGTTPTPTATPTPTPTLTSTPTQEGPLPQLQVHFIDVGQGDAILLDLDETEVLIDGGDRSPSVTVYLQDYVDGTLEVMIATHPHADHIGGLIAVLDAFDVEEIWLNGDTSTSNIYADFMDRVGVEGAEVKEATRGDTIVVDGLNFNVLHPVEPLFDDTNNNSIVLMLSYGDIDFLFTGDAEAEAEASIIATGVPADIEILKVGHHGSRSSSSQAFLNIVQPEVAIYMAGVGNRYGHPHAETISALKNIGAEVYGTDTHGTIVVMTDGDEYTIEVQWSPTPTPKATPTPTVTLTPTPTPTLTPTPTHTPLNGTSDVQIICIFYDGVVYQTESDEYVAIQNLGGAPQDLAGWKLKDISEGYPSFTFPHYILEPGQTIRVYTDEIHPEWGGFSFGRGSPIWNNTEPDTAALYDAEGQEVSRKSYPPGC